MVSYAPMELDTTAPLFTMTSGLTATMTSGMVRQTGSVDEPAICPPPSASVLKRAIPPGGITLDYRLSLPFKVQQRFT